MAEKIKYIVEIDDNGSGAKVDNLNSKIKQRKSLTISKYMKNQEGSSFIFLT